MGAAILPMDLVGPASLRNREVDERRHRGPARQVTGTKIVHGCGEMAREKTELAGRRDAGAPRGPRRSVLALLPLLPVGGRAMGEEGWGDEGSWRGRLLPVELPHRRLRPVPQPDLDGVGGA